MSSQELIDELNRILNQFKQNNTEPCTESVKALWKDEILPILKTHKLQNHADRWGAECEQESALLHLSERCPQIASLAADYLFDSARACAPSITLVNKLMSCLRSSDKRFKLFLMPNVCSTFIQQGPYLMSQCQRALDQLEGLEITLDTFATKVRESLENHYEGGSA